MSKVIVVVGGGVTGVCCVEELIDLLDSQQSTCSNYSVEIVFVCGRSGFIKVITNTEKVYLFLFFYIRIQIIIFTNDL